MFALNVIYKVIWSAALFLVLTTTSVHAQDFENIQIETIKVTEGIYMLLGRGGNIGISAGDDGVFVIDDQFAPLTNKIKETIAAITDKPIRFVINTHWHADHTGGNENLGETGSIIVAHKNVRKRLTTEQFLEFFKKTVSPLDKPGLPVITFTGDLTFHLNDDEIYVFHVGNAHTDGDAIIYFRKANVVHMGDIYFSGMYPFIDLSSGGSINGMIKAVNQVLPMLDDTTRVIPGHGPVSNTAELKTYRDMLTTVRDRISQQINKGKRLEDVLSSGATKEYDKEWGQGIIQPHQFITILYKDLSR
jgi:glyoxylase-like metal-dependent hydrolase (beta-lactamase superfamily II)